jgi:SSS family solute:Na+ symporter
MTLRQVTLRGSITKQLLFVLFWVPDALLASEGVSRPAGANLHLLDLGIIGLFLVFILCMGLFFYRWIGRAEDFTVAGRNLPPFILAATMAATNINMFGMVSQSGTIYRHGISIAWQGWTGCMALAFCGLFILPVFRRLRVATLPEFLEHRYGRGTRGLLGFFSLFRLAFWLGVILNISAIASQMIAGPEIKGILDGWGHSFGIPVGSVISGSYLFWVLLFSILVIAYTFLGGMWSVAILDALDFVFIIGGALILMPLAMHAVGGFRGMTACLTEISPQHLDLIPLTGKYSWTFVLAIFFLGIQWASTDPGLVQKSFSSRDNRSLAKGLVLCGIITVPFTLLTFLPALASRLMYPELLHQDYAYPSLMVDLLPMGLLGLVCVGLLGAQFSTIDTNLTSAATIFTNDVYCNLFRRRAADGEKVLVVRVATLAIGLLMISFSLIVPYFENAVDAYLTVVSFSDMPLFVVAVLLGLLWPRANSRGAVCGYLAGFACGAAVIFPFKYAEFFGLDPTSWLARNSFLAGVTVSALACLIVGGVVSLFTMPPGVERLRAIWAMRHPSEEEISRGITYHLWPASKWGKFWLVIMFFGCFVFLSGIVMGALEMPGRGWVSISGMVVFFIGAWFRLLND